MQKAKLTVGVIYGGKSPEHEVSLQSARNIIRAIDQKRFDIVPIAISKNGEWTAADPHRLFAHPEDPLAISIIDSGRVISMRPGAPTPLFLRNEDAPLDVDVVFPILHGAFGEDGSIQGLLKYLDIPFVGPGILGSAVGMDKDIMKRILNDAGIRNSRWVLVNQHEREEVNFDTISQELGLPVFIKPANLGSSVGVHRANTLEEFNAALDDALSYDKKVIIEETIVGRELECALLGNEIVKVSTIGEVLTNHRVYSYEAKYLDSSSRSLIPAELDEQTLQSVQDIAIQVYKAVNAEGLSRVDCFLTAAGDIVVNEINTIPGFTDISMYPKLWAASGLEQTQLITELIDLAMARHQKESALKSTI